VLNKEGKRKVAALAGLNKHGDRVFSAAAEALLKAYPNLVQRYSKHLLGRRPDHPWIVRNKDFFTTEIVADSRGTAAVPMGVNQTAVPALEIISWLFKEAKEAARHHVRASVVSAVIAVPPFFTQWERAALLQAAKMAGLEVLSLVNEGTAVAIDYFVSRTIGEEPKLVMLYDMGDVSTKVRLRRKNECLCCSSCLHGHVGHFGSIRSREERKGWREGYSPSHSG
jgi:hypoxia up-regulated 1